MMDPSSHDLDVVLVSHRAPMLGIRPTPEQTRNSSFLGACCPCALGVSGNEVSTEDLNGR